MITILIKDSNSFYRNGLQNYLKELFFSEWQENVRFVQEFNSETVSEADVIIMELCKGETKICTPELISRKRSLFIGVVNGASIAQANLPICISDVLIFERKDSLGKIMERIISRWKKKLTNGQHLPQPTCSSCNCGTLSTVQMKIMASIYCGFSIKDIAKKMSMSCKAVYAHKHSVMSKFNLRNTYDLINFIKCFSEKNTDNNTLRDIINHSSCLYESATSCGAVCTVSIFQNGDNRAIRLPHDLDFEGVNELEIIREGDSIILHPVRPT